MNLIVLVLVAVASALEMPLHDQKPGANPARINACSFLTREVVMKVNPPANKYALAIPAAEEPVGPHGSYCEYGGIGLQIDPFVRSEDLRKAPGKEWQAVSGLGDTAWFRDNKGNFAELMVWTGAHHFTIQMSIPMGGTAEKMKPNTLELANTIIPKLK